MNHLLNLWQNEQLFIHKIQIPEILKGLTNHERTHKSTSHALLAALLIKISKVNFQSLNSNKRSKVDDMTSVSSPTTANFKRWLNKLLHFLSAHKLTFLTIFLFVKLGSCFFVFFSVEVPASSFHFSKFQFSGQLEKVSIWAWL